MQDVIVIGGGLSGLTIAYQLKKRGLAVKVLEAQHRLGGRIETIYGKQKRPWKWVLPGLMQRIKIYWHF